MSAQAALLPLEGLVALGTTTVDDVTRARAYVTARSVVCCDCGEDEGRRLVWVHEPPGASVWDCSIARLVALGAATRRLAIELTRCVCVCRRCLLRRAVRHVPRPEMLRAATGRFSGRVRLPAAPRRPQMLRSGSGPSVGLVAKVAIARCGGRKPAWGDSRETGGDHSMDLVR